MTRTGNRLTAHKNTQRIERPSLSGNILLGLTQILVWGGSFFLMAVLINPVIEDTNWPYQWIYGSLSISLFISGLLAPKIGKMIADHHGRILLLYSGFVIGLGLMIVAVAPALWVFVCGWCVIGVGMAMGLFDALFAALGKQYGVEARRAFTHVTLVSGFCTTLTWPLLAWLMDGWGWRTACLVYALLLWITVWPLYRLALPQSSPVPIDRGRATKPVPTDSLSIWLLGSNFTLAAIIMTVLSVQLITILQSKGIAPAAAIGMGTLIGPCQVGVRLLDLAVPKKHPIWNTFLSTILTLLGLMCLNVQATFAVAGVVLYSLGNGLRSIIRGSLPLALFGPVTYPLVLGRLARPALIAQALTPMAGGFIIQHYGVSCLLTTLVSLGILNIGVTALLNYRIRHATHHDNGGVVPSPS